MTEPTRIMVDIETLGIEPGAAILQIGACTFDREGPTDHIFEASVDLESCQAHGLEIDADTLQWWLDQDAAADVLTGGDELQAALAELAAWLSTADADEYWANSPKFDMAHLEAAYDAVGIPVPWDFYELRDVRTVGSLPCAVELEQEGTEHDALDDAIYQAREVGATLRALETRPVTDAELEDAREAIEEQREEIHEFLESEGVATDD